MSSRPSYRSTVARKGLLIGALLRVPAEAIHRRIIKELNAAGFEELRIAHMAVLQFPGPDGVRPGVLAERAGISKQAANQLLRSLEAFGYLARADAPDEGRVDYLYWHNKYGIDGLTEKTFLPVVVWVM